MVVFIVIFVGDEVGYLVVLVAVVGGVVWWCVFL